MQSETKHGAVRTLAVVAGLVLAVIVVTLAIRALLADADKPRRPTLQQIAILRPPPPPPPKPEQKPPEPEIKKQEVKIPDPPKAEEAKPDNSPPPGEKLGLDADGTSGSDGFGLAARKGGTDILKLGTGSGGAKSEYAWFAGRLERHLQAALAKHDELRKSDYRVVVSIWLAGDGAISRAELAGSSGDAQVDAALRRALAEIPALTDAPPGSMPQPLKIRIASKSSG